MPRRFVAFLIVLLSVAAVPAADSPPDDPNLKTITIKDLKYTPAKLTIKVGQTVRWINKDDNDHTVSAKDGSFKSDNLQSGETFEHTFTKPGKFDYGCKYHPRMKGQITVAE